MATMREIVLSVYKIFTAMSTIEAEKASVVVVITKLLLILNIIISNLKHYLQFEYFRKRVMTSYIKEDSIRRRRDTDKKKMRNGSFYNIALTSLNMASRNKLGITS